MIYLSSSTLYYTAFNNINVSSYRIIGNFSRREILAKMPLGRCVKFPLSPIFAILRAVNEDVK